MYASFALKSTVLSIKTRVWADLSTDVPRFQGKLRHTASQSADPIQDFREGYYVFLLIDFPTEQLGELERNLMLSERVIRHLVVRLDE